MARRLAFAAIVLFAASAGVACAHPDHPDGGVAAGETVAHAPGTEATESGSASTHHGDDAHAVDYNKPPLPGAAPGLLTLFLYSLGLFVLFLFVARQFVWKPLIQALNEREGRINRAYAEAEKARAEAARLLQMHEERMNEAHEQVKEIIAGARQQAEAEKSQIIAEAEAEARALRDRSLAEIRQAGEEALARLMATVDQQVALATEHVLGYRLN